MEAEGEERRRVISADISRAEREMEELCEAGRTGMRIGELLRKKVILQRRIQKLRDEERALREEELMKAVGKLGGVKLTSVAQQAEAYKRFIGGKLPRRKGDEKGKPPVKAVDDPVRKKDSWDDAEHRASTDGGSKHAPFQDTLQGNTSVGSASCLRLFSDLELGRNRVGDDDDKENAKRPEMNEGHSGSVCVTSQPKPSFDVMGEGEVVGGMENLWVTGPNFLQTVKLSRERGVDGEIHMEEVRRNRRAKMQATENRQLRSMQRLNLVEDMFTKAVERRLRAMRKIAADPPADRLIGNSAVQHVPVSMLPGQLQQTALAFMDDVLQSTKKNVSGAAAAVIDNGASVKKVFLTDVDAAIAKKPVKEEGDLQGDGTEPAGSEDGKAHAHADGTGEEDHLLRAWRELGYTVVFLPATGRMVYPGEADVGTCSPRRQFGSNAGVRPLLEPLPPIHLVQRRLLPVTSPLRDESRPIGRRRRPISHIYHPGKK